MKVLLCESRLSGHRSIYMQWLARISEAEMYICAPQNMGVREDHYFSVSPHLCTRNLQDYLGWIRKIQQIVRQHRIDVVHILDGDTIMRHFGMGFHGFRPAAVVITYHMFYSGRARQLSYRRMLSAKNALAVVHTENVQASFKKAGISRTAVCGYPAFQFDRIASRSSAEAKKYWNLPAHVPVIGIVGGLSAYKNILPFLEQMKHCPAPFHLLICGKPCDVSEDEIRRATADYSCRVTLRARMLTEEEYELAIGASDIIYCIYSHSFNGASGPLTDGVCAGKMILSCDHGSLGETVRENHLGFTAECSDGKQMLQQTCLALAQAPEFVYDQTARAFRSSLIPENFQQRYLEIYRGLCSADRK